MYPAFAYTRQMELILALIAFAETFCVTLMMSNILLRILGLKASAKQKVLFAFLTGTLAQNVLIYGLYLIGGSNSFDRTMHLIVTSPNVLHALLYYYAAEKILGLSKVRSVKITSYVYLIWIINRQVNRTVGAIFFSQNEAMYNYLKDTFQQIVYIAIFLIAYSIAVAWIKRRNFIWQISDTMFFNRRREIFIYLAKASFAYAVMLAIPLLISDLVIAYFMVLLILALFFTVSFCVDTIAYKNQTIARHETHISALFKGMEELRGIKHDFNNILHTYSGFLELEEYEGLQKYHASLLSATSHAGSMIELSQKMHENPAIISLLMDKLEDADKRNVKLIISLQCSMEDMHIDNTDASRILSCLLDNAIEAARASEQRKAYLSIESKKPHSKMVIVSNSASEPVDINAIMVGGMSTPPGHKEPGLTSIRSILNKYENSSFQLKYFNQEVSAYIELSET